MESGKLDSKPVVFSLKELVLSVSDMVQLNCKAKRLDWKVRWFLVRGEATPTSRRNHLPDVEGEIWFFADEAKLRQLLLNLLSNAVKFTQRGEIALAIGLPLDFDIKRKERDILPVYFEVQDTGQGISPEDRPKIMNPFGQGRNSNSEHSGVGLGLAISARLVEVFDGKLEYESSLGEGSRFYFTAHLEIENRPSDTDFISRPKQPLKSLVTNRQVKALVVDDIEANRGVLAQMLSGVNIDVETASDGLQALQILEIERPDIVFLDIGMPL